MRRLLSLWLPRFASDRWQRTRRSAAPADGACPAAVARPLALVVEQGGRVLLAALDARAAAAGLTPGLALADARALLPQLETAPAEPAEEARALERLADWCGRYSPWVALDPWPARAGPEAQGGEVLGGEAGLLLDISGCAHLFGSEQALAEDLIARLAGFGYGARIGIAGTAGAAWALARFATGTAQPLAIAADIDRGSIGQSNSSLDIAANIRQPVAVTKRALADLPPAALRLPAECLELLARIGLTRIGQLYDFPPASLAPRFGEHVGRRLAQALGTRAESISPARPAPARLARRLFAEPLATPEDLARVFALLAGELVLGLEREQMGARRLLLSCYRVDGTLARLAFGTSRPSRDPAHLQRLFARRLEQLDPGFGIDAMSLAALAVAPLSALQLALPETPRDSAVALSAGTEALAQLLDRLAGRLGSRAVLRPRPRESHLPERAQRLVAPLAAAALEPVSAAPAWPARLKPWGSLRPPRLLPRPEPVEALALLPDHPPASFRWRHLAHRVVAGEGPERIVGEWWRDTPVKAPAEPTPEADEEDEETAVALPPLAGRDYFRVEDEEGRRYWLFRSDGRWFLHGLFA